MTIKFECPECSNEISVADDLAGRKGKCVHCSKPIVVPTPEIAVPRDAHWSADIVASALRVAGGVSGLLAIVIALVSWNSAGGLVVYASAIVGCVTAALGSFAGAAIIELLMEIAQNTRPK